MLNEYFPQPNVYDLTPKYDLDSTSAYQSEIKKVGDTVYFENTDAKFLDKFFGCIKDGQKFEVRNFPHFFPFNNSNFFDYDDEQFKEEILEATKEDVQVYDKKDYHQAFSDMIAKQTSDSYKDWNKPVVSYGPHASAIVSEDRILGFLVTDMNSRATDYSLHINQEVLNVKQTVEEIQSQDNCQ